MDFLINCGASITRDLVCGAVHQSRYACCFNNLVEDIQKEQVKVIGTRKDVQERIDHDKKQTINTAGSIHTWLEEANKDIDNVEELLKKARTKKKSCCFGQFPNWIWRYRVGRQLAKSTKTVTKWNEEGSKYIQFKRLTSLPGLQYFSSERCLMFESRQSAYDQLMKALKDDEVNMIGLYGMGGCGKTTLAIEVGKRAKEDKLFKKVPFATVSSTVEVTRIQEEIASSLGYKFPEQGEMQRAQRLCERLIQEEKVLVILDNVWQRLDFEAIGIPSNEIHKGCKVLITTRSEDVCLRMDCQIMIQLQVLNDEEAWDLFQKQAHISEATSEDLKHLARQISDGCKGLPVAIAAVAGTLKGKAKGNWDVALDRLKNSKPVHIEKDLEDPYKCLRLSFDNLDIEEAKSLFLLCSVFPEEYEIPIEDLTRFAIGLGLIGEVHSYDGARNEVCAAKSKLISSCLLLDAGEGKGVKMQDLIRQVAHYIAKDEGKGIKCALKKDVTMEYSSPRYLWIEEFPCQLDYSNLEFLCISTYGDVLDEIFKGMKKLRVLFLVKRGLGRRPLLTKSFKSLTNLRCLLLEDWKLGDISFLGDLKKLESITMRRCSFLELPDIFGTQLSNLRLLDLSESYMKMTPFEVIGRHSQLEELYVDDCRSELNKYNERTADFFSKVSIPQSLQRYHIQLGTLFKYYRAELLNRRKTLFLSCFDTSNAAVKDLAIKAEVLLIANIQGGAKNIIPDIDGRGMNELIKLWISSSKDIEHLVDTGNHLSQVGALFSKLLELTIERMEHLRSLYHGQPPDGLFEKLEALYIRDSPELHGTLFVWKLNLCSLKVLRLDRCAKLTYLFTPAIALSLVQLEVLEISYCDKLKKILADDNKEELSIDDHRLVLPKLKQLYVAGCDMLEYIIPVTYAQGPLQLESLVMQNCAELKYVFGQCKYGGQLDNHQSQNELKIELPLLAKLSLGNLPNIISICPKNCYPVCLSLGQFTLWDFREVAILSVNTCMFGSKETQFDHSTTKIGKDCSLDEVRAIKNRELSGEFKLGGLSIDEEQDPLKMCLEKLSYTCNGLVQSMNLLNLEQMKVTEAIERPTPQNRLNLHLESIQSEDFSEITSIPSASLVTYNTGPFTLCNLKRLILTSCGTLRTLFSPSTAISLTSLEELITEDCPGLRYLVTCDSAHENKEGIIQEHSGSYVSIFPRLQRISVKSCNSLEYIFHVSYAKGLKELKEIEILETASLRYVFGHSIPGNDDAHSSLQYQNKIQIKLPVLEKVTLLKIPNMINICLDNYHVTCSSLRGIVMDDVGISTLPINNLMVHSDHISTLEIQAASMTNEQLLASVDIKNSSKIKGIFNLDELHINEPQVTSWLINLNLENLPELNYIMKGAKHSVTLQNLKLLNIWGCEKLKTIFSSSVSRSLPQLKILAVTQCEGLEQIIEDDDEEEEHESVSNHQSRKICFLRLKLLLVTHCNNLKRLFYLSKSHEFPELEYLIINQDPHIEQVFEVVKETRVEVLLPELKHVVLMQLPNLINVTQWIESQTVTNIFVHNCPKLSLTSTTTVEDMLMSYYHDNVVDFFVRRDLLYIHDIINEETAENDRMLQITSQLEINPENQTASGSEHNQIESGAHESHDVLNRGTQDSPSLDHKLSSHEFTKGIKETEIATTGKVSIPVKIAIPICDPGLTRESTTSLPTTLHKKLVVQQTISEPSFLDQQHELEETIVTPKVAQISVIPRHDGIEGIIKESVQEGSTSKDVAKATSSASTEGNDFGVVVVTHTKPSGGDTITQHSQLVEQGDKRNEDETGTTCQKIQNVYDSNQEGLKLVDKEGEMGVVSNDSIEVPPASADTSGSHSSIIAELAAYKHFVNMDDARIALLVEAIAVYPHLWNVCEKFSKRFQALMLQTLADMLLFLRNESTVSVTPQREKEFHKLCDEAVQLGFERSWVDRMRKRVTIRDPKVEQLSELLKRQNQLTQRQDQLTQELLKIKDEINDSFNDFVAAQNQCFDFM